MTYKIMTEQELRAAPVIFGMENILSYLSLDSADRPEGSQPDWWAIREVQE